MAQTSAHNHATPPKPHSSWNDLGQLTDVSWVPTAPSSSHTHNQPDRTDWQYIAMVLNQNLMNRTDAHTSNLPVELLVQPGANHGLLVCYTPHQQHGGRSINKTDLPMEAYQASAAGAGRRASRDSWLTPSLPKEAVRFCLPSAPTGKRQHKGFHIYAPNPTLRSLTPQPKAEMLNCVQQHRKPDM